MMTLKTKILLPAIAIFLFTGCSFSQVDTPPKKMTYYEEADSNFDKFIRQTVAKKNHYINMRASGSKNKEIEAETNEVNQKNLYLYKKLMKINF